MKTNPSEQDLVIKKAERRLEHVVAKTLLTLFAVPFVVILCFVVVGVLRELRGL